MEYIEIGERIKQARQNAGLTQSQLADALYVTRLSVVKWEKGELPKLENLIELTRVLDVDLDYLIGRIDSTSHALQVASEYTGLSEKAIETIRTWSKSGGKINTVPMLSMLLTDGKQNFQTVLERLWNYCMYVPISQDAKYSNTVFGDLPPYLPALLYAAGNAFTQCAEKLRGKYRK